MIRSQIWIWSSQILGKAFASEFDTLVETSKSYVENAGSSQARVQKHDAAGAPFSRTLGGIKDMKEDLGKVKTPSSSFPPNKSNCQGYSFIESLYQSLCRRSVALVNLRMIRVLIGNPGKSRVRFRLLKSLAVLNLPVRLIFHFLLQMAVRYAFGIHRNFCLTWRHD